MSNYGRKFGIQLFQVAGKLIDTKVVEFKEIEDPLSREITGRDISKAVSTIVDWFLADGSYLPDDLSSLRQYSERLRNHHELTVDEVAVFLMLATIIYWSPDPQTQRITKQDITKDKWCLSCYQEMLYSFLDVLAGNDFEKSLIQRTHDLRQRVEESGKLLGNQAPHRLCTKIDNVTIQINLTTGALRILNDFRLQHDNIIWLAFSRYLAGSIDGHKRQSSILNEQTCKYFIQCFIERETARARYQQ